jgi:hypothetical protein
MLATLKWEWQAVPKCNYQQMLGTALQARRSRVWLPMVTMSFFIHKIILAELWSWVLTHLLTEMSTSNISWGVKAACTYDWQTSHFRVPTVSKSWSLNLLEPSGPVQACNGIALHFTDKSCITSRRAKTAATAWKNPEIYSWMLFSKNCSLLQATNGAYFIVSLSTVAVTEVK